LLILAPRWAADENAGECGKEGATWRVHGRKLGLPSAEGKLRRLDCSVYVSIR
jgi:hypothetical protein